MASAKAIQNELKELQKGALRRSGVIKAAYTHPGGAAEPCPGVLVEPDETNLFEVSPPHARPTAAAPAAAARRAVCSLRGTVQWTVGFFGPPDTIYTGGYFKMQMSFPKDYPFSPPTLRFTVRSPVHSVQPAPCP